MQKTSPSVELRPINLDLNKASIKMKLIVILSLCTIASCTVPSVFLNPRATGKKICFCKEKDCTDVKCEEKNCLCLVVRGWEKKIEFCDTHIYYTQETWSLHICLFCDFNRKDSEDFKRKNVATINRFPTAIFNWSKNVACAFKDVKKFATPMNLCECDLFQVFLQKLGLILNLFYKKFQ